MPMPRPGDFAPRHSLHGRIEDSMNAPRYGPGIDIIAEVPPEFAEILTSDAVSFAA